MSHQIKIKDELIKSYHNRKQTSLLMGPVSESCDPEGVEQFVFFNPEKMQAMCHNLTS